MTEQQRIVDNVNRVLPPDPHEVAGSDAVNEAAALIEARGDRDRAQKMRRALEEAAAQD